MSEAMSFTITMEQVAGLEFRVTFDWPEAGELTVDEPAPLGGQRGPNASRLLAAAVGNCLSASLLFCLQRSKVELGQVRTRVEGSLARNDRGRLRIAGFRTRIELPVGAEERERLTRCLGLFEDYCVVTASVRQGIPVEVEVVDRDGNSLLPPHKA